MCDYVGKDKQTIYRHYTGKHKVVEQYLSDDIREGRVETLAQKQAKEAALAAEIGTTGQQLTTSAGTGNAVAALVNSLTPEQVNIRFCYNHYEI